MPTKFPRVLALTATLAAIPLAAAAPAHAVSSIKTYSCTYGLFGNQPVVAKFETDPPASYSTSEPNPALPVRAVLTLGGDSYDGFQALSLASIYGTIAGTATVVGPHGARVPVPLAMEVPEYVIPAEGVPVSPSASGSAAGFSLSDGDGDGRLLAPDRFTFTYHGNGADGRPRRVWVDLAEGDEFQWPAACVADPGVQDLSIAPVAFGSATVVRDYSGPGIAALRSKARGVATLASALSIKAAPDGSVAGTFDLRQGNAKLTAYGFLPVEARFALSSPAPVTGTWTGGVLHATAVDAGIAFSAIKVFGLALRTQACATKTPLTFTLDSPALSRETGGTVTGTFGITGVQGCGAYSGLLSGLLASANDSLTLRLK